MKRCSLCGRKISNEKYCFGLGCLKKVCAIAEIKNVKNLKYENKLNNKIQKINGKMALNKNQKQLLTDRYLTYQILCQIDVPYYQELSKSVEKEINGINSNSKEKSKKNSMNITLKEAFDILKLYNRYKSISTKIESYTQEELIEEIQNLPWDTLMFAFSSYYEKKPYLSDLMQVVQLFIWKIGVMVSMPFYKCGADFLNHSLKDKPEDIYITEGEIVEKIKNDDNFKNKVNDIIERYGKNQNSFNTEDKETLNYKDFDLFLALNNTRNKCTREKRK